MCVIYVGALCTPCVYILLRVRYIAVLYHLSPIFRNYHYSLDISNYIFPFLFLPIQSIIKLLSLCIRYTHSSILFTPLKFIAFKKFRLCIKVIVINSGLKRTGFLCLITMDYCSEKRPRAKGGTGMQISIIEVD